MSNGLDRRGESATAPDHLLADHVATGDCSSIDIDPGFSVLAYPTTSRVRVMRVSFQPGKGFTLVDAVQSARAPLRLETGSIRVIGTDSLITVSKLKEESNARTNFSDVWSLSSIVADAWEGSELPAVAPEPSLCRTASRGGTADVDKFGFVEPTTGVANWVRVVGAPFYKEPLKEAAPIGALEKYARIFLDGLPASHDFKNGRRIIDSTSSSDSAYSEA